MTVEEHLQLKKFITNQWESHTQCGSLGEILYGTPLHWQVTYTYKKNRIALFLPLSFIYKMKIIIIIKN